MYDMRTNLSNQVVKRSDKIFWETKYKKSHSKEYKIDEAPAGGMPISVYDARVNRCFKISL